jgi:hypothetical protein
LTWVLDETDPEEGTVERITFVLFFPDGQCALQADLDLPSGQVQPGEHWLLDACLRIPLETAGFRIQRVHPFARDGAHAYMWVEGDVYSGKRPHAEVPLQPVDPATLHGSREVASLVQAATRSYRATHAATYVSDSMRLLEPAYLRATTAEGGSGFSGTPEEWRRAREPMTDGITHAGAFLDVGCANGLLMESVHDWCNERGLRIEPYGIDIAPRLVELARQRLPRWADRIWLGNALDWTHANHKRFDYVHLLLDCAPSDAWSKMIDHHRQHVVQPGGRLLVSHYVSSSEHAPTAKKILADLGYTVKGEARPPLHRAGAPPQTAWIDAET